MKIEVDIPIPEGAVDESTEREREVPVLLADGMSTQEAAARLGIG